MKFTNMKDIDEVRRDNMRAIEKERGGPTEAANAAEMSLAQFANLRDGAKDSKTGKRRGMRKATARRIEEKCGKPHGWLDIDHENFPSHKKEPGETVAWSAYSKADEPTKILVDAILGVGQVPPWLDGTARGFIEMMKASARMWLSEIKKTTKDKNAA
ncbi:hypothetical protein QS306_14490 [Paraburkholderia bonniea]|uniref:hypothetical protein n=1 Tax=Paraburkholderia bonniea TaxID=2152891 RepID=UPI0025742523|nr:hypothetical protein [Paraburkholderia bonniea]WJF91977.1 hypothetical protein QS306_14490 [Paraburkholderia bonniea]WJF95296.1 hypothetical protein QS308_14495 [Paraburkholderia bonniea]